MDEKERRNLLAELAAKAKVDDLQQCNREDARHIVSLAGKGEISQAHMHALIKAFPAFIGLATESIRGTAEIAKGGQKVQEKVLDALTQAIRSLESLNETYLQLLVNAEGAALQELTSYSRDASRQIVAVAEMIVACNLDNNRTNRRIGGIIGGLGAIAFSIIGLVVFRKKPD